MSFVPSKKVIAGVVTISVVGAAITLVNRPASPSSYRSDSESSADITPVISLDAAANSPEVTVNGTEVPVKEGTTKVPLGNGEATVTKSGPNTTVNASSGGNTSASVGNVNISVQSSSSGNTSGSSSSHVFSNSFSSTTVNGNGSSHVEVHTP